MDFPLYISEFDMFPIPCPNNGLLKKSSNERIISLTLCSSVEMIPPMFSNESFITIYKAAAPTTSEENIIGASFQNLDFEQTPKKKMQTSNSIPPIISPPRDLEIYKTNIINAADQRWFLLPLSAR